MKQHCQTWVIKKVVVLLAWVDIIGVICLCRWIAMTHTQFSYFVMLYHMLSFLCFFPIFLFLFLHFVVLTCHKNCTHLRCICVALHILLCFVLFDFFVNLTDNGGKLNAWGIALAHSDRPYLNSYRWEHPGGSELGLFFQSGTMPSCLPNMGTLSTQHIYLESAMKDFC